MAITITSPSYGFTNRFPLLTISGTAGGRALVSLTLDGMTLLDNEVYFLDASGQAVLRGLGDLFEKYFYDASYDIRKFAMNAVLKVVEGGITATKSFTVYFCRSYVGGDAMTPDMLRAMPLTRSRIKHTLSLASEYLSFISTSGKKVMCDITVLNASGVLQTKTVSLYTFSSSDRYQTVDASAVAVRALADAGVRVLFWDVYVSGNPDGAVRYVLDTDGSFAPTTFVYQNCFGGIESFVARGIRKDELQAERETGTLGGRALITKQAMLRSYTVNTGGLADGQKEALIDLLSSYSLMVLEGGVALPVIVDGQNASMHNYRSKLPTAEFTYSHSTRNLTIYRYDKGRGIFDYTFDNSFN